MAVGANRPSRLLKWYMGRLEGVVGAGGTAVGSSISLADVLIYNKFAECLTEAEVPPPPPLAPSTPNLRRGGSRPAEAILHLTEAPARACTRHDILRGRRGRGVVDAGRAGVEARAL